MRTTCYVVVDEYLLHYALYIRVSLPMLGCGEVQYSSTVCAKQRLSKISRWWDSGQGWIMLRISMSSCTPANVLVSYLDKDCDQLRPRVARKDTPKNTGSRAVLAVRYVLTIVWMLCGAWWRQRLPLDLIRNTHACLDVAGNV